MASAATITSPWQRWDRYGECGLAPQPLWENARMALVMIFILPFKILGSFAALLSFFLVIKMSFVFPRAVRSDWIALLGKIHCRICLFFLGFVRVRWIDVDIKYDNGVGVPSSEKERAFVGIVSNHVSWCDILVHMSHFFPSFVARSKTERMTFIGTISKAMGCLYVERAKCESQNLSPRGGVSARVVDRMNRIAEGNELKERPILLFPEGTTTNGQFLLPFKSGAFLAGEPLQPVILRYGTKRISPSWESIVAHRHIILMLLNIFHSVTCYKLPVYYPSEKEKKDPQLYAANVRKAMLTASGLKPSTQTYIDKVKYNDALRAKYGYYPPGFPTREPTC